MPFLRKIYYIIFKIIHTFFPVSIDALQDELSNIDRAFWESERYDTFE